MDRSPTESSSIEPHLGFLSVSETSSRGFVGGFLILNRLGHPIEFHCTVPVHPNKAQEILYGRSLKAFLFGNQIVAPLYKRRKTEVLAVLTDSPFVLPFQDSLNIPLMILLTESPTGAQKDDPEKTGLDSFRSLPGIDWDQWKEERRQGLYVAVSKKIQDDSIWDKIALFQKTVDLTEPFERIRLAIKESQRSS